MKRTALLLATIILLAPMALFASDGQTTYDAKCKMCHGPDGAKVAKADLSKPDAELVKFIMTDAKHKSKAGDEATAKAAIAYMKSLKK
jgi:cytochrome c553